MQNQAMSTESPHREPSETERQEQALRWQEENRAFIAAYNQVIEEEGLPLEAWRMF